MNYILTPYGLLIDYFGGSSGAISLDHQRKHLGETNVPKIKVKCTINQIEMIL